MNFSIIGNNLDYFFFASWPNGSLGGLALTIFLSISSGILSAFLGLILGILLVMSSAFFRQLLLLLCIFFRSIPIIMLIFWFYFLFPMLFSVTIPKLSTVVGALSLISGIYVGHTVAAGLHSIPKEQWQAAFALGFDRWQIIFLFILPQALPRMAPSLINQCISLTKDTSLAYIIGVQEFLYVARQVDGRLTGAYSTEIYLFIGLIYFFLCISLTCLEKTIKRYYSYQC